MTVPSFRVDVAREVDLIEEVGRHYGFDRLPVTFPALAAHQPPPDPRIARDRLVRQVLTAAGFSEAMTFAFIESQAALPFCEPGVEPPAIANPLSEKFAVLRPSLLAGARSIPARTTAGAAARTSGCSRPAAGSRRPARGARPRSSWCGAACRAALVGAGARGGFLRRERGRRAAVRGVRRRARRSSRRPTARISCAAARPTCAPAARALGVVGQLAAGDRRGARASRRRRDLRRRDRY